ncbi:MAG: ABC transporter substrate-binding protein [Xanthomonadales bacterium]|nr:ABC transporter substrate-binding protein [Xanthomonadales bacterium]
MMRRFRITLAVVAALALVLAACGDDDADSDAASTDESASEADDGQEGLQLDEPVKIALLIPRTGSAATPEVFEDPMEMALEKLNDEGGIGGQDVEVSVYDTGFSPEDGLAALQKAVADEPDVAMGFAITAQVLASGDVLGQQELPLIHFSAADETNLNAGGSEWSFRVKLQNSTQAAAATRFLMEELGAEDIGLLYENSDYGKTAAESATETIEDAGGQVVAERDYSFDATDLTEQVLAMKGADAVLNWGFPNTIGLQLNQFVQNGIDIPTIDSDSAVLTFQNGLAEPEAMEQFYAATVCNPGGTDRPEVQEWASEFEERYGYTPEANSAFTYDSVFLYAKAIEQAGSTDGAAIQDALANITYSDGVCSDTYEADEDHNLSHDTAIAFFGDGENQTVKVYEG